MTVETPNVRGVVSSIVASVLFGMMFFIAGILDASAESIFGWRMLLTAACFLIALATPGGRRAARWVWGRLTSAWWMPLMLIISTILVGVQMWLFSWSPLHGHALDASLGYLLLPIALVLVGRLVFGEQVSRIQWIAVVIAAIAVAIKLLASATLSWVTLTICIGYAAYFGLRKHFKMTAQAVFGAEVAVMLPVATAFVLFTDGPSTSTGMAAVILIGLAGAVAMSAYLAASRLLTMPMFGLLGYVEPVLLFVAALILGETLTGVDAVTYSLLALALTILSVGGFQQRPRQRIYPTHQYG